MKPTQIIVLLKKAVEKKSCRGIIIAYKYAQEIDWEHVDDKTFKKYDDLISPANDILYEKSITKI